ncbi:hypothetical protein H5410_014006 [Solanum commersonii]|uniref:Uncharacterized protein n=1 Tax=Solanum commersonii TaxID=4109 RepID=A0A9J5ZPT3_SOLCO|nr:hypothetical protein H5410_014006 [Solanum commersonii]
MRGFMEYGLSLKAADQDLHRKSVIARSVVKLTMWELL